jgi:hypothetical protein
MSFIKKNSGSRIDHWGTPALMKPQSDDTLLITTLCFLRLYLIIDNPQTTADILNRDLDKIHTWSTNWLVSFNPQKTETMTISRKKRPSMNFI